MLFSFIYLLCKVTCLVRPLSLPFTFMSTSLIWQLLPDREKLNVPVARSPLLAGYTLLLLGGQFLFYKGGVLTERLMTCLRQMESYN